MPSATQIQDFIQLLHSKSLTESLQKDCYGRPFDILLPESVGSSLSSHDDSSSVSSLEDSLHRSFSLDERDLQGSFATYRFDSECQLPEITLSAILELIDIDEPEVISPIPPDSPTTLNPFATEFTPGSIRAPQQPVRSQTLPAPRVAAGVQVKPPYVSLRWVKDLEAGARSERPQDITSYAHTVANSGVWTLTGFKHLTEHIVWLACEAKPRRQHRGLAPFVVALYKQLGAVHHHIAAESFYRHLRSYVLQTFRSCWDYETSKTCISMHGDRPSVLYVDAALSLVSFVGELLPYHVLPVRDIHDCLCVLITHMDCHERVQAIRNLVVNAGIELWCGTILSKGAQPCLVEEFAQTWVNKMNTLSPRSSVHARLVMEKEIEDRANEVLSLVRGWVIPGAHGPAELPPLRTQPLFQRNAVVIAHQGRLPNRPPHISPPPTRPPLDVRRLRSHGPPLALSPSLLPGVWPAQVSKQRQYFP